MSDCSTEFNFETALVPLNLPYELISSKMSKRNSPGTAQVGAARMAQNIHGDSVLRNAGFSDEKFSIITFCSRKIRYHIF